MADITRPGAFAVAPPWRTIAVAIVVIALLLAAAVAFVGSQQRRVPPPFGPAANGLIPYVSNGDIYVGDPETGTTRLLVGGPRDEFAPQYSHDGTRVAFGRGVNAGGLTPGFDVFVVRGDGSDPRRITTDPLADGSQFAWTPDGRDLAVIHKVAATGCAVTVCFTNQLDLFDATGSGSVERIATAAGMDFAQFRPPDGHEILYRAVVDGKLGLFAVDADGTHIRPLITTERAPDNPLDFGSATYSADGTRIFYQAAIQTTPDNGCCSLWVMDADGGNQHRFATDVPASSVWEGEAEVSPDGQRIAFWRVGTTSHISVVRADGTGPVIETGPKLPGTAHWVWSPDSSTILMYPNDATNAPAYLLDPEGGPWTTVPWRSDADLDWQRTAP